MPTVNPSSHQPQGGRSLASGHETARRIKFFSQEESRQLQMIVKEISSFGDIHKVRETLLRIMMSVSADTRPTFQDEKKKIILFVEYLEYFFHEIERFRSNLDSIPDSELAAWLNSLNKTS